MGSGVNSRRSSFLTLGTGTYLHRSYIGQALAKPCYFCPCMCRGADLIGQPEFH